MAALTFPSSPVTGQIYSATGKSWQWDGTTWRSMSQSNPSAAYIAKVVCVGGETTISFSNIPQNFTDLELVVQGRDSAAGTSDSTLSLQFNGDTTSGNYDALTSLNATGAAVTSSIPSTSSTGAPIAFFPNDGATAGAAGMARITIQNYAATSFHKQPFADLYERYGTTPSLYVGIRGFTWKSTAAITSLVLTTNGSGCKAGSTFTLYGKGAVSQSPSVYQSTAAPGTPYAGMLWWKSDEGTLKTYYGSAWVDASTLQGDPSVCQGRLTLATLTPITTTDQTAKTTIYWTPYKGNRIALYDGSSVWAVVPYSEISIALGTLTSGKNYDVFCYNNSSGTPALEFSAAWSSDTARTDAISLQDGVYVKTGNTTRRYLGTFRTTSTTTTEDSAGGTTTQVGGKRFLWNYYNRVARPLSVIDTTSTWSYATDTIRQANGASGNKVEFVLGLVEDEVTARVVGAVNLQTNSARGAKIGVGLDSTSAFSGLIGASLNTASAAIFSIAAAYDGVPSSVGYHYLSWNERGADGTSSIMQGSNGNSQNGLTATVMA